MNLVVDANIIFSALVAGQGKTHELLFKNSLQLHTPEFLLEELRKHREELTQKTSMPEKEIDLALSIIFSRINIVTSQQIDNKILQAEKTSPDPDDSEYFALAMTLKCPIWSNDKKLKQQDTIKIINTTELIELLK